MYSLRRSPGSPGPGGEGWALLGMEWEIVWEDFAGRKSSFSWAFSGGRTGVFQAQEGWKKENNMSKSMEV